MWPAGWAIVRGTSSRSASPRLPSVRTCRVVQTIEQPGNTVRRGLECLHMRGVLVCEETEELVCEETEEKDRNGKEHTVWRYRLAD